MNPHPVATALSAVKASLRGRQAARSAAATEQGQISRNILLEEAVDADTGQTMVIAPVDHAAVAGPLGQHPRLHDG